MMLTKMVFLIFILYTCDIQWAQRPGAVMNEAEALLWTWPSSQFALENTLIDLTHALSFDILLLVSKSSSAR